MSNLSKEQKSMERKKVLGGLALTLLVLAWFLYYLLSHIPG